MHIESLTLESTMVERIVVGPMFTNAYIYSEWKKECIVLDPGGNTELILSHLSLINMKPRGILLTHGHIDHISAALGVKNHYAESGLSIEIAIHKNDVQFMGSNARDAHEESFGADDGSGHDQLDAAITDLPEPDIVIKKSQKVFDSDLLVIHTPGHTPGSICVYSESQQILFSGDTLLFEAVGRTDLPGGDAKAIIRSIRERIFTLPEETRVFPGHGPFTTLEREIRHNPFFSEGK